MLFPQNLRGTNKSNGNNISVTAVATYNAVNGDIVQYTPTAASVVNLPPVAQGGPVTVVNLAAFTITVKTTDGSTIQGVAGSTGYVIPAGGTGAAATVATFVSDESGVWLRVF